MNMLFQTYSSPVGLLYLVATDPAHNKEALHAVVFEGSWDRVKKQFPCSKDQSSPVLRETQKQLGEYFRGERKVFELPYILQGSAFQNRVWKALASIPYGTTWTYKEQAMSVNSPGAVRAVGRTNGSNLFCIILPCHRVIGSNGSLTGYAAGVEVKKRLLQQEGAIPS